MCGIVGVINWNKQPVDSEVLRRMAGKIKHRGPDSSGMWVDGAVGLGHQRLAIIDLTPAGGQPMSSSDGRYHLVYNGEIYNYRELKEKYCRDINFRSTSDTEVLLNLLSKQGVKILPELRGMFALALWDKQTQELLLARDPFGKKPLCWWQDRDTFIFGSEIKAIIEHPNVTLAVDKRAVVSFLVYEYVPEPATGWQGIQQLPMGSWVKVKSGKIEVKRWWMVEFEPKAEVDEEAAAAEFDELMKQAVRRRLVADVPVGLLLSGGIDSTAVGWYMKELGHGDLHSFSIGFEENMFNEAGYAQQAASVLGTRHHHRNFGRDDFQRLVEKLTQMDILLSDSSLLPTWAVSELASQEVKVVLDGDGSDELLGGYGIFEAAAWAEKLRMVPAMAWRMARVMSRRWPTSYEYFTLDFQIKSFLRGMGMRREQRQQAWLGSFQRDELQAVLTAEYGALCQEAWEEIVTRAERFQKLDWFDSMSGQIIQDYLQNDILVKLDRAAMAFGLEARTPFLDVDLAEFIMRLPAAYKRDKRLLKRVMRGRIPESIIDRRKQGFAMPLGHWLRGEWYEWARTILKNETEVTSVVKAEAIDRLLTEHKEGKADHRKKLWTLITLGLWMKRVN